MNKNLCVVGLVCLLLCVGLSGCTDSVTNIGRDSRFTGTWQREEYSYSYITFFSDGTGSVSGGSSTWDLKDGKLVITTMAGQGTATYDYTFSNNDNTLTLTSVGSGTTTVYNKQ